MNVTLIEVPYDSGHYARRMGRGPVHLIQGGLVAMLEQASHDLRLLEVRLDEGFLTEVGTALETQRLVAECVAAEIEESRFPLVLSGNCATCVGTVAGIEGAASPTGGPSGGQTGDPIGVVWLDSHGDFNTPETSRSGFFDGMVLAMLAGDCWAGAASAVPGFQPVPGRHIVTVGLRDLDPDEEERFAGSEIRRVGVEEMRASGGTALGEALDVLAERVAGVYLHLDLDVLDPGVATVNPYQAPNGLTVDEILEVISAVSERLPLRAAALTAFDPEADATGAGGDAALRLATALAAAGRP